MANGIVISAAVEGIVDEAVVRKLIISAQATPGPVYGRQGKASLRQKIHGYNNAARHAPWVILVDLDRDDQCAPPMRHSWLPDPAPLICFRIAVREVEAWIMADSVRLANFLGVPSNRVPANPETLDEPKAELVNLARLSRRKTIQQDMVPRQGSGRQIGPAYSSRLIEFVSSSWRPDVAAHQSDSLRRALTCLRRLAKRS